MDRTTISIPTASDGFDALLTAADSASRPGLLLVPETLGLNPHAQQVADLYAEEGYLVLIPDLLREAGGSTQAPSGRGKQPDINQAIADAAKAVSALRQPGMQWQGCGDWMGSRRYRRMLRSGPYAARCRGRLLSVRARSASRYT